MEIKVNPTRMELIKLRRRIKLARRGHKLLKEKRDGLMKHFMSLVRKSRELREEVDKELEEAFNHMNLASALMSYTSMSNALSVPSMLREVEVDSKNVMSVKTPIFSIKENPNFKGRSYGFVGTSSEVDSSVEIFERILPKVVQLAEIESHIKLLAKEVEKTRRRVNALEHVIIPALERAEKEIKMKLDEMERSNFVMLMRIQQQEQES